MKKNYTQFLKNIELFQGLSNEDLERISDLCHEEQFQAGEIIFQEGVVPDRFYIVMKGKVEVWKDYGTPFQDILALRGEGASFGEMALIDDLPRSATIRTAESTQVLFQHKKDFHRILEENHQISMAIMRSVSFMVRQSNETFINGLRDKNQKLEQAYEEIKQAQKELLRSERLSTLGKFASMILHDLRNPLSILKGYGEMLQFQKEQPEKVVFLSQKILNEADRLNRMVGELLDYSRGDIRLNLSPVSLGSFFMKIRESLLPTFEKRKIEILIDCRVDEPILMDQERMSRVIYNLSDNARKAMPKGGRLDIRAFTEKNEVVFEISDNGVGMTPEVKEKMFEPFYSSSTQGGTGLGTIIVSNVIEAHGGRLEVESEVDQGTKIRLFVPQTL